VLKVLFPASGSLGMTLPSGDVSQSFFLEIILTAIMMLTILSVSHGAKEKGITAAIAIGSVVGLEAMFAGPISGASMNPARSLGPALVSWNFAHIWLYPVATILGALIAIPLYRISHHTETPS
jgi:aquaporin Z